MVENWYSPQDFGFNSEEDLIDSSIVFFIDEIDAGHYSIEELEEVIKVCKLRIKYLKRQERQKTIDNFYEAFDALDKVDLKMVCFGGPFPYDVLDKKEFEIIPK